ncbi:hypothetical protein TanjilG_07053 [Lupinus angustifolius]|uniref:Uncharacterized protein n=1 Tax=Lupinus angustifolius TaxID=3871 RepID=A0A4P1QXL4_LUPAN|nr:hypothetical protein TanjilG_07053 [Lupinus angustifolius]
MEYYYIQQRPPLHLPPPPPAQSVLIQWFGKRIQELTELVELPVLDLPIIITVTTPTITLRITVISNSVAFTIVRSNFNTSNGTGLFLYSFYDEPGRLAHGMTLPTYLTYPAIITINSTTFTLYLVVNLDGPMFCTQDNASPLPYPPPPPPYVYDPNHVTLQNIAIPLCININLTRCDHVKTCTYTIYIIMHPNYLAIGASYQLTTTPWVAFLSSRAL